MQIDILYDNQSGNERTVKLRLSSKESDELNAINKMSDLDDYNPTDSERAIIEKALKAKFSPLYSLLTLNPEGGKIFTAKLFREPR